MHHSFTGTSRRPRQVNLSGRPANPFASLNSTPGSTIKSPGPLSTVASAQQERQRRKQERDSLNAAKLIQRTWRGHRVRQEEKAAWRRAWDGREGILYEDGIGGYLGRATRYHSTGECLEQVMLLLRFFSLGEPSDVTRLERLCLRLLADTSVWSQLEVSTQEPRPLRKLEVVVLETLGSETVLKTWVDTARTLIRIVIVLAGKIPHETAQLGYLYYDTLSKVAISLGRTQTTTEEDKDLLTTSLSKPLLSITSETDKAYEGFVCQFLTTPDLEEHLGGLDKMASAVNYSLLAVTLATLLERHGSDPVRNWIGNLSSSRQSWLLAYFIYFHTYALGDGRHGPERLDPVYIGVVSNLLSLAAEEISKRIDIQPSSMDSQMDMAESDNEEGQDKHLPPLPQFIRQQVLSLVQHRQVSGLLAYIDQSKQTQYGDLPSEQLPRILANYALALLRVFPRHAEDIRMWLLLGSLTPASNTETHIPAIKYFWRETRKTTTFKEISHNSRAAVGLLRGDQRVVNNGTQAHAKPGPDPTDALDTQDWRIILLFFELYNFVLKVTDDDEFFSQGSSAAKEDKMPLSWIRQSALPLSEVQELTTFLKNLGFAMYWYAAELTGARHMAESASIGHYFNPYANNRTQNDPTASAVEDSNLQVAGIIGVSLDSIKGTVTGLLRMLYERDSRRQFLPANHWLMTGRFDMEGFIPAVVEEEENRHKVQEDDDEDDQGEDDFEVPTSHLVGSRRAQQTRSIELLQRQQQKASRKKYLEAITPRLEILQNMPFLIPFETRVKIFREFVHLDQVKRRGGYVDPDQWRMSQAHSHRPDATDIGKHNAEIRRTDVFADAYDQFYPLGEGLKEPIQISFVDRFDLNEAGIDGGGVTKEFLTSVTSEAFSSDYMLSMFVENDRHLLYPNPSAVDQLKDKMRDTGIQENSQEWMLNIREYLRRFEFLGRIIGKCLYEGILVDVNFAGFFLLKWALTGGRGVASKESGYRPHLNDLRDLDETLYQGLLQLKNYTGDVAEDFSLDFTITDTIGPSNLFGDQHTRTVTRDLRPNGSNIAVTNENKLFYISLVARHRLQVQPQAQTSAFLKGLGQIIQPSWLSMFNQAEIQTLIGGESSEIDVADLRKNTLYGGIYTIGDDLQEHPSVKLFWQVLQEMSDSERRMVLKFVTSTPRGPLLGFSQLNPRFSIRDAGADEERLPSTSTCVNLLKLPRYTSAERLREKLLYAINSGAGFDLS
ncbi:MAG: hypothetical protein M1824_006014 [Vezdaea acicularis]|nr:MAG: hypothetical protein M1824_006014 [Vezdaea acicularis]